MSFRENLKQELTYLDMQVKELAEKSGVNARTINNYLSSHGSMPAADSALKIANALGVSVDYLVNGGEAKKQFQPFQFLPPEARNAFKEIEKLPEKKRNAVYKTLRSLINAVKEI